jgi:hypothetical protein
MVAKAPKGLKGQAKKDDEFVKALLADPGARRQIQEMIQRQAEDWVHQKIPALGDRTPSESMGDPDGREIVESLLLDWERQTEKGGSQPGIRPDFAAVRKLLNLIPAAS